MSFKNYKTRALHEMDIDWKVKNTLSSHKTDHKTGNFSVSKRWMSDQERVGKMNKMMSGTGFKMDADGLLPDAGAYVHGHVNNAIDIGGNMIDKANAAGNRELSRRLGKEVNIKNMDGETFKNQAKLALKDTAFNINKNIPGTQAHRFQGVANAINSKNLKASYEPEGEFLSYEEVEIFVESLVEQGYTEEQILLELDRKGLGSVVLGKSLELGMGAIKNTFRAGKSFRGAVNRAVSDTKLLKKIDNTARTLRNQGGNTFKGFKDRAGSIVNRVKGKLNRTDIKTNTVTKSVNPQVLGGAAAKKTPVVSKMKNVTPIGNRITSATNKIKAGTTAGAAATAGVTAVTTKNKVEPPKVTPSAVTNGGKKEVTPTKNPVVTKTKTSERGKSVDRAYGAMIAQTRKLKGDAAANKQRQKFINRPITSKEMDESVKDELLDRAEKAHKKAKTFKQWRRDSGQKPLKRGEVRKLDKKTGKWISNKPD